MTRARVGPGVPGAARARAFSLIELMATVAIVAILAAIAIPSYRIYVLKSHRVEAKTALLDAAALEERFYTTNFTYSGVPGDLGYPGATWPAAGIPVGSGNYYQMMPIEIQAAIPGANNVPPTPAAFSITVQPIPGSMQAADTTCATFVVTSTGTRKALDINGNDSSATCW
jgi:type IV pilus assembly protein PilE